jgi:hypothetical protein
MRIAPHTLFLCAVVSGCGLAHEMGPAVQNDSGPMTLSDSAPIGTDASIGVSCGHTICAPGLVCCNASCGICAGPGASCFDLACGDADAGPTEIRCGGIAYIPCPTGMFCDFPIDAMCGSGDQQGTCRSQPTVCPEGPPSITVCGCDYRTYNSECEANVAGTSVAHTGGCPHPTPARPSASATPTCGPADGPAWHFIVSYGAPVCGPSTSATTTIDVFGDPVPGTTITIRNDVSGGGNASWCSGGSTPCVALEGTVTFSSFTSGGATTFSYDLVDNANGHYPGSDLNVLMWCPSERFCG